MTDFFLYKNYLGGINDIFENNARINIKMKYLQNTETLYKANNNKNVCKKFGELLLPF
jgi:hypothetical protein